MTLQPETLAPATVIMPRNVTPTTLTPTRQAAGSILAGRFCRWLLAPLLPPAALASGRLMERTGIRLVSLVLAVCTAIFVTKGFVAYHDLRNPELPPYVFDADLIASLGRLWLCCAEDFAVGLSCLLLAILTVKL